MRLHMVARTPAFPPSHAGGPLMDFICSCLSLPICTRSLSLNFFKSED